MLVIGVDLLHGVFRGAGNDLALSGLEVEGEWPPSPARLFSALVAGDGTGDRRRFTDGSELLFLERQPPPIIHADRRERVANSPLLERFVVVNEKTRGTVQEYPARTASLARGGTRLAPENPRVVYVWPDAQPEPTVVTGLRRRAARIGYLGTSDSPARVWVAESLPAEGVPSDCWEPDEDGDVFLPIPFEGMVGVLDQIFEDFTYPPKGAGVVWAPRRSGYRTEWARYRSPEARERPVRVGGTRFWLRLDAPIPGRKVVLVAETLRNAVIERCQRLVGTGTELPSALTGHGFDGPGYGQISWLPLPDVGHRYSRGRIFGASVVVPSEASRELVTLVGQALGELRRLTRPGLFDVGVRFHGGERHPWAANPRRWEQPSTSFSSVFPVVHERFVRPKPSLDDVASWCRHAGLPDPVEMRLHRYPTVPGGVDLHPTEVRRKSSDRRPFSHLDLVFDRPIVGPVAVGGGRHFGLGLMVPTDRRGDHT